MLLIFPSALINGAFQKPVIMQQVVPKHHSGDVTFTEPLVVSGTLTI